MKKVMSPAEHWYYIEYDRFNTAYSGATYEGVDRYYKSSGSCNKLLPDNYDLDDVRYSLEKPERNIQIKYVIKSISRVSIDKKTWWRRLLSAIEK